MYNSTEVAFAFAPDYRLCVLATGIIVLTFSNPELYL